MKERGEEVDRLEEKIKGDIEGEREREEGEREQDCREGRREADKKQ